MSTNRLIIVQCWPIKIFMYLLFFTNLVTCLSFIGIIITNFWQRFQHSNLNNKSLERFVII